MIPLSIFQRIFFALQLILIQVSHAQPTQVSNFTLNANGHSFTNSVVSVKGSIAQPVIHRIKNNTHLNHQGFWYVYSYHLGRVTTPVDDKLISELNIKVYPNPFTDHLNFEFIPPLSGVNCQIRDITGRIVLSQLYTDGPSRLNVQSLPSGIYNIQFQQKQLFYSRLLIKL